MKAIVGVKHVPLIAHKYGPHCGLMDGAYALLNSGHLHWTSWFVLVLCLIDLLFFKEGV